MRIEWQEAVEHVVGNQSRTDQESLSQLRDVLDDPHLNKTLGAAAELPSNVRAILKDTLTSGGSCVTAYESSSATSRNR